MPALLPPSHPLPYGRQHISDADVAAVVETLRSDFLTQGPKVAEFEAAFATYVGAKHAVAVTNGTAALHLCALALEVQPGQRVITTPITFAASANCVRYCGGEVHFADIDPATARSSPEVGDTLRTYRADARVGGAVTFGMNATVAAGIDQVLRVGQAVHANYVFE